MEDDKRRRKNKKKKNKQNKNNVEIGIGETTTRDQNLMSNGKDEHASLPETVENLIRGGGAGNGDHNLVSDAKDEQVSLSEAVPNSTEDGETDTRDQNPASNSKHEDASLFEVSANSIVHGETGTRDQNLMSNGKGKDEHAILFETVENFIVDGEPGKVDHNLVTNAKDELANLSEAAVNLIIDGELGNKGHNLVNDAKDEQINLSEDAVNSNGNGETSTRDLNLVNNANDENASISETATNSIGDGEIGTRDHNLVNDAKDEPTQLLGTTDRQSVSVDWNGDVEVPIRDLTLVKRGEGEPDQPMESVDGQSTNMDSNGHLPNGKECDISDERIRKLKEENAMLIQRETISEETIHKLKEEIDTHILKGVMSEETIRKLNETKNCYRIEFIRRKRDKEKMGEYEFEERKFEQQEQDHNHNDSSPQPPPPPPPVDEEDLTDSKSNHGSRDNDRESSRSREKERENGREKERKREKGRDRDRSRDRDREKSRDRERERSRDRVRDRERSRDRGRDSEKSKDREHDRDGEKERDRERDRDRDHHRDRHRDRSERRERVRDRDDDDYHRSRGYDRRREYDREDRHRSRRRSRSRSRSRARSEHRSRSRSRSRSKSKRTSGFDMAPPTSAILGATGVAGQITGASPAIPGMFPNMFPLPTNQVQPFSALPVLPVQAMTQQATRHARRVYVGGLSPTANEQSVATFFSQVMATIGGNTAGPGDAVVNVYINHDKKFAFVEMRSVEEASNAMALDGIIFEGAPVKVRRPTDYNPSLAAALGPSQPNPNLNLGLVGLSPGSAGGLDGPDRIFVGGVPYYFTETQIRELLETFGPLRGFDLVKDRETGNSKGYAFCVYQDLAVTDIACAALNGIKMGDKTLTVRRANQNTNPMQPKPEQESILMHAQQQIALQKLMLQPALVATKVLCLTHAVSPDELKDDEDYEEILDDMRQECSKFGNLVNVVIPRPRPDGELCPGVGKVFLEYADVDGSTKARSGLNGRKFGGNQVIAVFYPENKFAQGDYEG